MKTSILAVDDETDFLDSVERVLRLEGYEEITPVLDPTKVAALLDDQAFDVAFLDITMPKLNGLDLIAVIKEKSPETECIMVTANEDVHLVVKAIKRGAYDYLVKPITPDQLVHTLDRALERKRLFHSLKLKSSRAITRALDNPGAFRHIITGDPGMIRLLHETELHAVSDIPVLLTGETGVGKEMFARAVHLASRRNKGPFVPINMLSLSPALFESEFFGHVRGAFTGAERNKVGYLDQADGGTLFLDEIGDLSIELQGKLLRILQEGEYVPVGDTTPRRSNVRVVAATNQDLEKRVQQRRFRKDLFYRLQFARMDIPPLRDRGDDVNLLAAHFLKAKGRPANAITDRALLHLTAHAWPGNVRELKGVLEAAVNLADGGDIVPRHLKLPARQGITRPSKNVPTHVGALEPLEAVERRHIIAVYEALGKNKSRTARVLDIGLQTLHRKLRAYGVA